MNTLKILFVGIGSIAKRHIRNLYIIAKRRRLSITIDAFRRIPSTISVDEIQKEYTDLSSVPCDYDVVFITNPTELHFDTLKQFHNKGKHFFIEKPVVSLTQLEAAKEFELRPDSVYYVACPLRYNAIIQYIKDHILVNEVLSVRSISSSYLPDWRKCQDYRQTYSAHKEMGGGVSIDLIHEWDYLTYLFGWPREVKSMMGKKSNLEIDSDDYAIYIAEYSDKIVELHLDYFGRKTIRTIELFTENDTIIGNIANNRISFLVSGKTIDFHEERDDYQRRELEYFIDQINNPNRLSTNSYLYGIKVLELTQGRI